VAVVSYNFHDIDTTAERLRENSEECVIFIEGDEEYNEHVGLTASQAEQLIADSRRYLDELYVKEA
jgi:ribonuclease BN (tRNA processing enzyme)